MSFRDLSNVVIPETTIFEDPRFRYGDRPIPEDYIQASGRYYLPYERDHRFFGLEFDLNMADDCWKYIGSASLNENRLPCKTNSDCKYHLRKYCTEGAANYVPSQCNPNGVCEFKKT